MSVPKRKEKREGFVMMNGRSCTYETVRTKIANDRFKSMNQRLYLMSHDEKFE